MQKALLPPALDEAPVGKHRQAQSGSAKRPRRRLRPPASSRKKGSVATVISSPPVRRASSRHSLPKASRLVRRRERSWAVRGASSFSRSSRARASSSLLLGVREGRMSSIWSWMEVLPRKTLICKWKAASTRSPAQMPQLSAVAEKKMASKRAVPLLRRSFKCRPWPTLWRESTVAPFRTNTGRVLPAP